MKSDEKWPVLIVRLLDVAGSLWENDQTCVQRHSDICKICFGHWTSESKLFVFKVKHIVTVGEPLGCALANRCLAARWANGERLTNRAHKFETIPSEDAKESCRHVVWRPCSSSAVL